MTKPIFFRGQYDIAFSIIVYVSQDTFHSPDGRLWHSVRRQNVVHKMMGRILFHFFQNTKKTDAALKIRQSSIYYAGLLGCWNWRLIDQGSDGQSIFFFNFLQNSLQKLFQFIDFTKIEKKVPQVQASNPLFYIQSLKIILWPSDPWSMRRLTQWPSAQRCALPVSFQVDLFLPY